MMRGLVLAGALFLCPPSDLAAQDFHVADSIVASGIRLGIYPGAVLIVGRKDTVLHQAGFGHFTWRTNSPAPTPDSTLWDLASLTKVVGTTGAIMRLVEDRRIELDTPVVRYLPRFSGGDRGRVTVRMLLDHSSGLPSYVEFFKLAPTRDSAISLLYATPFRRKPGTAAEYSDLNFLLLGLLVERVSGEPLDGFVERNVLAPAGMRQARYRPPRSVAARTAPSSQRGGRPVCCVVNDQNAARIGGAAGHAGLFSTGSDLARYARLWLNEGALDGHRVFLSGTIRAFLSPDSAGATRLLGWERPPSALTADPCHRPEGSVLSPAPGCSAPRLDSAYGSLLSPGSYGHTGWTGTLIWVDPARDLFLILLTNRTYAPRVRNSIRALRAVRGALADAVVHTTDPR
ncbi:MAG: serine hydrolase domain-containing protein [Gemmatimonadota bacterium]